MGYGHITHFRSYRHSSCVAFQKFAVVLSVRSVLMIIGYSTKEIAEAAFLRQKARRTTNPCFLA